MIATSSFSFADERIQIPSSGISLAARVTRASSDSPILILAHGFAGDKDEKGLFIAARDFFAGNGFSVLRFDFRGCGESGGDFRTVRLNDLVTDLANVIKYVRKTESSQAPIGLVSFSLAAGVAVLANSGQVRAHVFWSPAVYTDRDMAPRYRTAAIEDQISRLGWFNKSGVNVGGRFLEDLASSQIEDSLHRFHRAVLIVHGKGDKRIPSTSSELLMQRLAASSRLRIIPGADHSFRLDPGHRELLFSATAAWLNARLNRSLMQESSHQPSLFEENHGVPSPDFGSAKSAPSSFDVSAMDKLSAGSSGK